MGSPCRGFRPHPLRRWLPVLVLGVALMHGAGCVTASPPARAMIGFPVVPKAGELGAGVAVGKLWNLEFGATVGLPQGFELDFGVFSVIRNRGIVVGSPPTNKVLDPAFVMFYFGGGAATEIVDRWTVAFDLGLAGGCGGFTQFAEGITVEEGTTLRGCDLGWAIAGYMGLRLGWRPQDYIGFYTGHRGDLSTAKYLPSTAYSLHVLGVEIAPTAHWYFAVEGGAYVVAARGKSDIDPMWNASFGIRGIKILGD